MPMINIQSVFIFYSAISTFCGLLLIGLFWGRKDLSASIWIACCFLSALATSVTVFRTEIPLVISYSLMISIESASLLLMSQSLWSLLLGKKVSRGIAYSIGLAISLFILHESLRYIGNGKITAQMSFLTTFTWIMINLYGAYTAKKVGEQFQNRLILNCISAIFFCISLLYVFRGLNMFFEKSYHVFDPQLYNFITYFSIAVLSTLRNLIYINLRMHLGFAEHGRLNNMNMALNNLVEERERMIAAMLKSNKSSSTEALSVSIAHELNQPLGASLLNIQFLKMLQESGEFKPELVAPIVYQLEKDTKRSSEVLLSLRAIFTKDSGSKETVQVRELVDNALAIYKSELISKNIQIKLDLTGNAVFLFNKGQFLQVLLNLINNAIQALSNSNSAQKLISLDGYQKESKYILEITDNGPGVSADQQPHLFGLLNSDKANGMGVGLWLSAYIMSNAGGKITYQDASGGGAKFILSFPY